MEQTNTQHQHVFQHHASWFVVNADAMSASAIDVETAARLAGQSATPGTTLKAPQTTRKPMPVVNLCLFLTQSCNLNCVYCYGNKGRYGGGGRLDQKTAFQAVDWLIDQAGETTNLHIGFFGGEPFLNFPIMKKVVSYAVQRAQAVGKTIEFNTTTNATLLGDEQIAFIKQHKINVMVSFDGTKELQDAQRP